MSSHVIVLSRDCEATEVPYGGVQVLPAGTRVRIMQSLGGTYTVATEQGSMMRIEAKNADALGVAAELKEAQAAPGQFSEKLVWERPQNRDQNGHDCARVRHGRRAPGRYRTQARAVAGGKRSARRDRLRSAVESRPNVRCRKAATGIGSRLRLAASDVPLLRIAPRAARVLRGFLPPWTAWNYPQAKESAPPLEVHERSRRSRASSRH